LRAISVPCTVMDVVRLVAIAALLSRVVRVAGTASQDRAFEPDQSLEFPVFRP
jgi:hypothetical protein